MGEAERRAFFLLDMMIGDLGGDNGAREGVVARVDLVGVLRLTAGLVGVPRLAVCLEGVPREMVALVGVPSSLRGVLRRPAVRLWEELGVASIDFGGVLSGELPSSKRLTLDSVPWPRLFTVSSPPPACDVATFAGVLLGVFRIGLFSLKN